MAFRYRQVFFEDGDIISPKDWNRNIAEYTQEFNGYLDRDNLPSSGVTSAMIKDEACNSVHSFSSTTDTTITGDIGVWQSTDGTTKFSEVSFTLDSDAMLILEWSGTWEWSHSFQLSSGATAYRGISVTGASDDYVEYRILVDGIEVCRLPKSVFPRVCDSAYMVGAIPVAGGNHTVTVQARNSRENDAGPSFIDVTLKERELFVWVRKR